ncbi:uncharacterized protein BX664DRAFT_75091 [Halteromyces radiatus]|uniref:uncharacterized protein n=1 Tax=Halteromyces radiatus TaxID=101107 RepID=UPI00221EC561|nr:uncharacterized protein BX664DRAFT_75091 [Halteromyces radiatus]KAI8097204.1 hypothetical protein BX664DRAFT_75091 [Halteromyces radiatus]
MMLFGFSLFFFLTFKRNSHEATGYLQLSLYLLLGILLSNWRATKGYYECGYGSEIEIRSLFYLDFHCCVSWTLFFFLYYTGLNDFLVI